MSAHAGCQECWIEERRFVEAMWSAPDGEPVCERHRRELGYSEEECKRLSAAPAGSWKPAPKPAPKRARVARPRVPPAAQEAQALHDVAGDVAGDEEIEERAEDPAIEEDNAMKVKRSESASRTCALAECGGPNHSARSLYCSVKCGSRAHYLELHQGAKRKGVVAESSREPNPNGRDKSKRGITATQHMAIAGAPGTPRPLSIDLPRTQPRGSSSWNGSMRISRAHLDAWWLGLSDDGAFEFFARVMFPGVGIAGAPEIGATI
jgi:hypothetical protein